MISMVSCAATRVQGLAWRSLSALAMMFVAVFVMAGLALPGAASAQSLIGSSVTAQYHNPTLGSVTATVGPVTVGSGVEVPSLISRVSVDVSATQIVLTQTGSPGTYSNNTHNGPVLVFTGVTITSASLDPSSTMGVTSLSFTGDSVIINWGGQPIVTGATVVINVNSGPTDTTPR